MLSATILIVARKLFNVSSLTGSESESITVPGAGGNQLFSLSLLAELQAVRAYEKISRAAVRLCIFIGSKNRVLRFEIAAILSKIMWMSTRGAIIKKS